MKFLLDTNTYSGLMLGRSEVADWVRRAERVFLSTIVTGELLFGFRNGNQSDKKVGCVPRTIAYSWLTATFYFLLIDNARPIHSINT